MKTEYVALRRLDLGGGRLVMAGELIPDGVRDTRTLLSAGWIERVYTREPPAQPENPESGEVPATTGEEVSGGADSERDVRERPGEQPA